MFLFIDIIIYFNYRDSIPGPLTNVLDESNLNENKNLRTVSRHESIGGQDPGVVGPIVWDLHCQQIKIKNSEYAIESSN